MKTRISYLLMIVTLWNFCSGCAVGDLFQKYNEIAPGYYIAETDGPTVLVRSSKKGEKSGIAIVPTHILAYDKKNEHIMIKTIESNKYEEDTVYYLIKILPYSNREKEGVNGPLSLHNFDSLLTQLQIKSIVWETDLF